MIVQEGTKSPKWLLHIPLKTATLVNSSFFPEAGDRIECTVLGIATFSWNFIAWRVHVRSQSIVVGQCKAPCEKVGYQRVIRWCLGAQNVWVVEHGRWLLAGIQCNWDHLQNRRTMIALWWFRWLRLVRDHSHLNNGLITYFGCVLLDHTLNHKYVSIK